MSIGAVGDNSSTYGAAFREKPLFLKTHAEVSAFLEGKIHKNMSLQEDSCTLSSNNSYRNHTVYEVSSDNKEKTFLDFGFLIRDETSSIKGKIEDEGDVDFYNFSIPYNRTFQNYFDIEVNMEVPEGSNYNLTLYDEYGNQVGKAEWDGSNQKTLKIPNWDTKTSKYCLKVENEAGQPIDDDGYKISFHVSQSEDTTKTDAIRDAFIKCNDDYVKKNESYKDSLAEYNRLLQEAEDNYSVEVDQLHQKQFDSLPEELQYHGELSSQELLQKMASGEQLNNAEMEYVKIYSNLKDFEKAQKQWELQGEFSDSFQKDLSEAGISLQELENMKVQIDSNGKVTVEGIKDEAAREQVENLIEEKYSDPLYGYYIGIADSVSNLPSNVYQFSMDVQEVERFLRDTTNGQVALKDLYFTSDGKIGGLPQRVSDLVNQTKDNAKIDSIRTMMKDIIGYQQVYGTENVPDFSSIFTFSDGAFQVVDSGFHNDVEGLSGKMNSVVSMNNMYSDTYQYEFKKVL